MGYSFNMGYSQKGFDFQVAGFTDHLDKALKAMVEVFLLYDFTLEDFT